MIRNIYSFKHKRAKIKINRYNDYILLYSVLFWPFNSSVISCYILNSLFFSIFYDINGLCGGGGELRDMECENKRQPIALNYITQTTQGFGNGLVTKTLKDDGNEALMSYSNYFQNCDEKHLCVARPGKYGKSRIYMEEAYLYFVSVPSKLLD